MEEKITMITFSQIIFKAAFEKLIPEIMKLKDENLTEEEFHEKLMPKAEAMVEAILGELKKEDKEELLPEIFQGMSLSFMAEKPVFENYIKQNKREEFKNRILAGFTTTALLMAVGKIFEWGNSPEAQDAADAAAQESEEPVIPE